MMRRDYILQMIEKEMRASADVNPRLTERPSLGGGPDGGRCPVRKALPPAGAEPGPNFRKTELLARLALVPAHPNRAHAAVPDDFLVAGGRGDRRRRRAHRRCARNFPQSVAPASGCFGAGRRGRTSGFCAARGRVAPFTGGGADAGPHSRFCSCAITEDHRPTGQGRGPAFFYS